MSCDVLSVDFLQDAQRARPRDDRHMDGLSSARLRQFHASGRVELIDEREGISLTSSDLIYEKDRHILHVQGRPRKLAQFILQRPGELHPQLTDAANFLRKCSLCFFPFS